MNFNRNEAQAAFSANEAASYELGEEERLCLEEELDAEYEAWEEANDNHWDDDDDYQPDEQQEWDDLYGYGPDYDCYDHYDEY